MSLVHRATRAKGEGRRDGGRGAAAAESAPTHRAPHAGVTAPAWAAPVATSAPFAVAGVQRKVTIGAPDDAYEREAEQVASRVASGHAIAPEQITPIGSTPAGGTHRAPTPAADEKKEDKPKAPAVQKAAAAPDDRKKEEEPKPPAVHKAAAPPADRKKEEKPRPPAVQKAAATPDDRKKEDKPKPPVVQKAATPGEKKKEEEKPKAPAVQKVAAPSKRREEKPKSPRTPTPSGPPERETQPPTDTVQKAPAAEPKKDVRKPEPKKPDVPAQKAEKRKEKKEGETLEDKLKDAPVQKAAAGAAAATPSMESTASQAIASKGAGEPLHAPTRDALESRIGADLGSVRVHDDSAARRAADAIDARAFTHGSDVWLGSGESQSDLGLMAHEATHVVQQAGGAHRLPVQREGKKDKNEPEAAEPAAGEGGGEWDFESPKGKIDKKNQRITIPKLQVPTFKKPFTPSPLKLPPKEDVDPREDVQIEVWEKAAGASDALDAKIDKKCKDEGAPAAQKNGEPIYFLELPGENFFVIGTKKEVKQRVLRPFWNKEGKRNPFQVDHKQEFQLQQAGEDPDRLENFWLLDAEANMASGRNIKAERDERLTALLEAATKPEKGKKKKGAKDKPEEPDAEKDAAAGKTKPIFNKLPDPKQIRHKYQITFEKVEGGLDPKGTPRTWTLEEIKDKVAQVDKLKLLSESEIKKRNLQGSPKELVIYTNETGASKRTITDWPEGEKIKKSNFAYGKRVFQVDEVEYDKDKKEGMLRGTAFKGNKLIKEAKLDLPIRPMDAVLYGGYIPRSAVSKEMNEVLDVLGMSPVEMYFVELTDKGFVGRGRVLPTVPLIKDVGIDLVLDGDDIYLRKVLSADDFKFPGPIQVTSASLELYAGTNGVGAKGTVFFEVERVGRGKLAARGSMDGGFGIAGDFDFDSDLFDPAAIHVEYAYRDGKGTFSGAGEIGITQGKVKGIDSASLKVSFVDDKIDATGTVKPNIPAIEQGDMEFHYAPETGIVIAGKLTLKKDTPGIESGSVSAELAKRPGDDHWRVKAAGEAVPRIPGMSAKLLVSYDDGLFDITGTASYEKGMLKGAVTLGVTNRPVSPEGAPAGEPADKAGKVTLYGGGSLTLRLAPWLAATATVRLLPNGEIEVTGQIGLPAALELFKGKELSKNVFKVGIDIPIVGLSAAGQHIGIFASIGGGMDVNAGIGPGMLQELSLGVTYNPAHEDETRIFGGAKLHIPAHAGLRLFVRGSLGVGIPLVDAQAGIELGGSLGIEGALDASVQVDWTPTKGLDIQAVAEIYAEPKFKFDITGFVLVELDLLIDTIELYSKRWQLASVEYGSGLRLGLKLPIHYHEGQPFDVSLSDVQFEVPSIDPGSLIEGLVKQIA